jgi:hypothetical protein
MRGKCTSLWGTLQAYRKGRLPGGVHHGSFILSIIYFNTNFSQVVGHMEEDHLCAASVHTCGEVRLVLKIISSVSIFLCVSRVRWQESIWLMERYIRVLEPAASLGQFFKAPAYAVILTRERQ